MAPVEGYLALIDAARRRAYQAVETALCGPYWQVGGSISRKLAAVEWGSGVVDRLAATIARVHPGPRGFTRPNVFRMRRFFGADRGDERVAPLVGQFPWTRNLTS